jgi:hypothetical protein
MQHTDLNKMLSIQLIDCLPDNNSFRGGYDVLKDEFKHYLALSQPIHTRNMLIYLLHDIKNTHENKPLIIHLFCHSNEHSILANENSNEQLLSWEEFVIEINQIDKKINNQLTVIITGCKSYNVVTAKTTVKNFIGYDSDVFSQVAHHINHMLYVQYVNGRSIEDTASELTKLYSNLVVI